MIIYDMRVYDPSEDNLTDIPKRIHMMISEGINLSADPVCREQGDWTISYFNTNVVTFDSDVYRCMVDPYLIGRRDNEDITALYLQDTSTPFYEAYAEYWGVTESDNEEELVLWEGAFNSCNLLGQPYYPVTVFTPDQQAISRELFMPVIYLNQLLDQMDTGYVLESCTNAALNGEIVFELKDRW